MCYHRQLFNRPMYSLNQDKIWKLTKNKLKWKPKSTRSESKPDIAVRNRNYHTATGNHMPYEITQCYLPPGRGDFPGEIRPSAETPSSVHWRRFYFQLTRVHNALKLFGRCALQIYLLTYLLTRNAEHKVSEVSELSAVYCRKDLWNS